MAPVCQMCGHTGFQEVMIYCRQCRIACEHKYCLYKFPKKGEKVRWFCEECKPTVFAASSPKTQEVDTGRGKLYPESVQKLQNQKPNPNLKNNNRDAFCWPQLEMIQEEAENIKSSPSDLCENKKRDKRSKLITSNACYLDLNAPDTPLNHLPTPSTSCSDLTMHEVSPPEATSHTNTDHQEIEVCRSETSIQPPNHFPPPSASCGDLITHEVPPLETTADRSTNHQEIGVDRPETYIQAQNHFLPPSTSRGDLTMHEVHPPETTAHRSTNHQGIKVNMPETCIQAPNHFPPPSTSCGDLTMHEVSPPETTAHRSTNHQDIEVDRPETCIHAPNHFPPPSTSCGDLTMHESSLPESTHRNTNNQKIEVYRPEAFIKNIPPTAGPFTDFVWRGCISFGNAVFIPFRAHGSREACQRVFDAAKCLPPILPMDKYLIRDLYQNIFKSGPANDDKIGLYFIPDIYAKPELVFRLIDDTIKKDLMFVFTFDEIELLVFPSCILPEEHHKLNEQYYLWGAFRKKQLQDIVTSTNHHSEPNSELTKNIQGKEANVSIVTCTNGENQKPVYESQMKHAEDKADARGSILGSPFTEELKRIVERINEKHTENEDKNPTYKHNGLSTANRRTIEQIRAKYRDKESNVSSLSSKCTEMRTAQETKNDLAQNKKVNSLITNSSRTLNQHDKENSYVSTQRNSRMTDESRKRERIRNEAHAYSLKSMRTERQQSLYESKKKYQKSDNSSRMSIENRHIDDSRNRECHKDGNYASSFYVERQKRLDELRKKNQKNHGTNLISTRTEKQKQETKKFHKGEEFKGTCLEKTMKQHARIANESSASPVSSIYPEEQKQRDAMDKFDCLEGLEEGEICEYSYGRGGEICDAD